MGTIGLRQLFDYDTWTYTYLLWDQRTKVIIDPVREQYLRDLEVVTDLQLKLLYALERMYADHVTALGMLRDSWELIQLLVNQLVLVVPISCWKMDKSFTLASIP